MAKKAPEGKKYNYMDTYGDLVTLLLCFFVLLFSMSTVDEAKYNAIVEAFSSHFGNNPVNLSTVTSSIPTSSSDFAEQPPTGEAMDPDQVLPADFYQLAEAIERYVEENNMQGEVMIERGENNTVFIRMNNNLVFRGDSYELLPEAIPFLDFLSECFNEIKSEIHLVTAIGHTAEVQGSGVDDWILSGGRAGAVTSHFEKATGFPAAKLQGIGYGRTYPIADNNDPVAKAANRRVDIIVVGSDAKYLTESLAEASHVYFPDDDIQFFQGDPADLPGYQVEAPAASTAETDLALEDLTEEERTNMQQAQQDASGGGSDTGGGDSNN